MDRIEITREERTRILSYRDKLGYVGVVRFRGPRGRKYVPLRTRVYANADLAQEEVGKIRAKPYRHGAFATGDEVVAVDHMGRVQREEG
jgi:ribosomal protein L15E